MNIYDFFNSPDVAEYCKSINHKFNAVESAVMIDNSTTRTLEEKLNAYRTIIADYPDMEVPKGNNHVHLESFHMALGEVITFNEKFIEKYFATEQNTVFQYRILFSKDYYDSEWYEEETCFATYEKALTDGAKRLQDKGFSNGFLKMEVQKKYLDKEGCLSVSVNKSGEILGISSDADVWDGEWNNLLDSFYIDVPIPFTTGDLVEYPNGGWMGDVYVLQKICRDAPEHESRLLKSDTMDMTAGVFYESKGIINCECIHFYPDLRYCRCELKGQQRILKYVSLAVQDKLCYCALLKIQKYLMLDELISDIKKDGGLKYQLKEFEDKLLENPISSAKVDKIIETFSNCQAECTNFNDESGNYDEIWVLQARLEAINGYLNYIKPFLMDLKQN
jgi:hypothetical protein